MNPSPKYNQGSIAHTGKHSTIFFDQDSNKLLKVPNNPAAALHEKNTVDRLKNSPTDGDFLAPYLTDIVDVQTVLNKQVSKPALQPGQHPLLHRNRAPFDYTIAAKTMLVLQPVPDMVTLTDVCRHYPDGAPPQDVAWILRRMLLTLGVVHAQGTLYLNALPDHIMLHGTDHGLQWLDWAQSAQVSDDPAIQKALPMNTKWEMFLPVEVKQDLLRTPATDIYMAARCWQLLIRNQVLPLPLKSFMRKLLAPDPVGRPQNALQALEEFKSICETAYGPAKYKPFDTGTSFNQTGASATTKE